MPKELEYGHEDWWTAQVERQKRDADRMRATVHCLRMVLGRLGLKLTGIEVDPERGRARGVVLSMLDARDILMTHMPPGPDDIYTLVHVDGVAIKEKR